MALIQKSIKPSSPSMRNHNVTKLTIDGRIVYDNATGSFRAFTCIQIYSICEFTLCFNMLMTLCFSSSHIGECFTGVYH